MDPLKILHLDLSREIVTSLSVDTINDQGLATDLDSC